MNITTASAAPEEARVLELSRPGESMSMMITRVRKRRNAAGRSALGGARAT
jgi:hypothetical protein